MTDLESFWVLLVLCLLFVTLGWWKIIFGGFTIQMVQIPITCILGGILMIIIFILERMPIYWYLIPGILILSFVIPLVVLWLELSWLTTVMEDPY